MLKRDVSPILGKKKVHNIMRADIVALLDGIVNRGAPIAANRTFAVTRKMFKFAVQRGLIAVSPCLEVTAPSGENRRSRFLDDDEIVAF